MTEMWGLGWDGDVVTQMDVRCVVSRIGILLVAFQGLV
jgi:hypothetical protein